MTDGNSLINLGELSKPATTLIEKVSDAVGGLFRPWQIKRVTRAEAEVAKIQALASIEISEMEQRALIRLIHEQGTQQENMERITAGAIPLLKSDAKPEAIEEDWLAHFFNKARIVSDEEMQILWSRLLSGEANDPGKYSKKTIEIVSVIDKSEAHSFTNLLGT